MPRPTLASYAVAFAVIVSARSVRAAPGAPAEPFSFADFTWVAGNARTKESPLSTAAFTGEFRADVSFVWSFARPVDDTIGGSSEVFRHGEIQVTQLGIGGDFHHEDVRGRVMTQLGMYSQTTPRNDASAGRGQWNLADAYRYLSEAYGGYHFHVLHGLDVQAGIFMSYVGLWSYYNFDNWSYQPSFVSSNTPWFFNGLRVQLHPSEKLKVEGWIVNGWQSYGRFNEAPGVGLQIKWAPNGAISVTVNQYYGKDTLGTDRVRVHTDDSVVVKVHEDVSAPTSRVAFSLTLDAGCEWGAGARCGTSSASGGAQYFLGFMTYVRAWFAKDHAAVTVGGGAIENPGRYLVLVPPINGATALSGTPYFTANPGDPYRAWDASLTLDWMPSQFCTFRIEGNHRWASVPYWSGTGGVTPVGGNQGAPGSRVDGFAPDLRTTENRVTAALLVKL